jgi:3-oxoacyl-[acyl-carrier protein] reductase
MGLLEDKVVLITGASRGIGKSIAEECVKQGAKVAFTYLSSDEKARALENELSAGGGVAKGFKSDASKFDDAQKLVDDVVAEFGTIDVLVNNAGITRDTLLMRMSMVLNCSRQA